MPNYNFLIIIFGIILITLITFFLKSKKRHLNIIILLIITVFLFSFFKPSLIFSNSITAGGDTASHYYTASFLKNELFPKSAGWTMGNYAGYPILQFYFPLPFMLMVLLSYIIPLQVAFKIVTVLGTFLLPISVYYILKLLDFKFPTPILGAIFSLAFLFNEENSMWGGNIPSTLAGEFSHSLSLSLSVLFFGTLYYALTKYPKNKKLLILNSILFTLISLSHIYTMFIASLSSLFLLSRNFKKRFIYMTIMYSISLLLMSFWIIPFFLNIQYTTAYNINWNFNSFFEVVPIILIPFFILGIIGILYLLIFHINKNESHEETNHKIIYLLSPLILSFFFFGIANHIGLVDIRFLIVIYLWSIILAAIGTSYLLILIFKYIPKLKSEKSKKVFPLIILILTLIFINANTTFIPSWIKWNYEGFEGKASWPEFVEINKFLEGTVQDPRVVYEHSHFNDKFGTERAFESLPLFSGRSTLEGVYMQSSISSPFIFYIQSEISEKRSCPFWNNYQCTSINLNKASQHLKMFNVLHYIVRSDKIKSELVNNSNYNLLKKTNDYEIYKINGNTNKYVTPLKNEPILLVLNNFQDWKQISYEWFTKGDLDTHLVFSKKSDDNFILTENQNNLNVSTLKKVELESCKIDEEVKNNEINIKTDCINKPVLIKVSYHPGWKVQGADKIYLVSPSFMLIYPTEENVRLYFN